MWTRYPAIALRNLRRHRAFTLINLTGLTLGVACCLLIFLFVRHELSYDRFHERPEDVYRLTTTIAHDEGAARVASSPAPAAPLLQEAFPQIEAVTRIFPSYGARYLTRRGEVRFYEDDVLFVDPGFFDVFSFHVVRGDPATALADPQGIVLTQRMATRYFGEADPMGKELTVDVYGMARDYRVTGVVADIPSASHFSFEALLPFTFIETLPREALGGMVEYVMNWENSIVYTYLRVADAASAEALNAQLPAFAYQHRGAQASDAGRLSLEPLLDIYLRSDRTRELGKRGSPAAVYGFSAVALLILLLACANYVNLATAQATRRVRAAGVHKALGAGRAQVAAQSLAESLVLLMVSVPLALALATLALPIVNESIGATLSAAALGSREVLLGLLGLVLVVGFGAGSYPALVLARTAPARALRGAPSRRSPLLRQGLVAGQFAVSAVLLVGVLTVAEQMRYAQTRGLGFTEAPLFLVPLLDEDVQQQAERLREEALRHPAIAAAAVSEYVPGRPHPGRARFTTEAHTSDDAYVPLKVLGVDAHFLDTYELGLVAGRSFSPDRPGDTEGAFIINEAAARVLGWDDPLGQPLTRYEPAGAEGWVAREQGRVVGVVRDFHLTSLHAEIEPLVLTLEPPEALGVLSVRLQTDDLPDALVALERLWTAEAPGRPFEGYFLDQQLDRIYRADRRVGWLLGAGTGLAIWIACLGLFGLAAFTAMQRTKEVGIRKVLGASAAGLVLLLSKDFIKPVLVGLLVATPLAYLLLQRWLDGFAYRTMLGWDVFALTGGLVLVVAALTVSGHALRTARANPVDALRYE